MPGPRRLLAALLSGILATGCVALTSATEDFPPGDAQMEDLANYQPGFAELTTIELMGDIAYVYGVGGLTVLDLTNPANPVALAHYLPPGHPQVRFYDGEAVGDVVYATGREDLLFVIDLSLPFDPFLAAVHGEPGVSYEGAAARDGHLYAARHADGLEVLDLANPLAPVTVGELSELENAWDVAFAGDRILVADGAGGLAVVSVSDPTAPVLLDRLPTSGAAQDVDVDENLAAVASGSGGVDLFDISDPVDVVPVGSIDTPGLAMAVALTAGMVYVADYGVVAVYDVTDPANPFNVGWEDTPIRAMGLDASDDLAVVADWSRVRTYGRGASTRGDIHVPAKSIDFGAVPVGEDAEAVFTVINTGGATLDVTEIAEFGANFEIVGPTAFTLAAGASVDVTLVYSPQVPGYDATFVRIDSDDTDEAAVTFPVTAGDHPWALTVGDEAPDFTLADLGGVDHTLSGYRGRIVVMAFFANW